MSEQEAKEIVLEWLINEATEINDPIAILGTLSFNFLANNVDSLAKSAYRKLSLKSEYELLAEFSAWGLREGAE